MGFTVRKLQIGLLAGAALLVLVIAGFLGYARFSAKRFVRGLPGRLGIDIKTTTDNFTYSQSLKGKTVYTIHAAKAVQHSDGKWTLHDVGITLYGRQPDRPDHISGKQFEYDEAAGDVLATGEVQIDLAGSSAPAATAKPGDADAHIIHIRTSGLLFRSKTHIAATDQLTEFTSGGISGRSQGADYDSQVGTIILRSQVLLNGVMQDRPYTVNATHAELNQKTHITTLESARYASLVGGQPVETLKADHAIIHNDADNNPQRIEAEGNVALGAVGRGTITSDHADALVHLGRAQMAHLFGNLKYLDDETSRQVTGDAQDARIAFDNLGRASQVVVTGDVTAQEAVPDAIRDLHANRVELTLAAEGKENTVLQDAQATGGARIHLLATASKSGARTRVNVSDLSGDTLTAHFVPVGQSSRLVSLHGTGSTVVHRVDELGVDETSAGSFLEVSFAPRTPVANAKPASNADTAVQLQRAVQHGNVNIARITPPTARSKTPLTQRASAAEATYDADADRTTLSGAANLNDATSAVWATRIVFDNPTGEATATGGVRTTYLQPRQNPTQPAPEPSHVLADHAVFHQDAGKAIFFGKQARLWQAGTQVEAPILEFDQNLHTLFAHGDLPDPAAVAVHATLIPATSPGAKQPAASAGKSTAGKGPIRIASHELTYTDTTRQFDLRGNVRVDEADGVLHARQAVVFLDQPAQQSGPKTAQPVDFSGGNIDHVVATGNVELTQPGRIATGEQLLYTDADQTYVLTGTKAVPPKVVDQVQGTIIGDSMRFKAGDNSILVTGGDRQGRVHTETRVKQ